MPVLERTTTALRGLVERLRPHQRDGGEPDARPSTRTLNRNVCWMLGLGRQPFRDNAPADELFVDDAVEMQLNMLAEQLRTGAMLPLLKGEQGSGKTSLLIQLMARVGDANHFFVVRGTRTLTAQRIILDMLRVLERPIPEDTGECFRHLARQLRDLAADGQPAILVVDDADALEERELAHLLAAHDSLRRALNGRFRMLLAAEPAIELRLSGLHSVQLESGQVFSANVRPLARPRIAPYLAHRLAMAGYGGELPLDDDSLDRISASAGGLPRSVETAAASELNSRWPDD